MRRLLILLFLVSPCAAQTNTFCASNLTCTVTAPWSFTNAGTFTNTQMNEPFIFNTNSVNFANENLSFNGLTVQTEGLTVGLNVPSNAASTALFGAGLASWVVNNSANIPAVWSINGQSHCMVNNSKCWGVDVAILDTGGLTTGVNLRGMELDLDPRNASGVYGIVDGYESVLNAGQTGQTYAGSGFHLTSQNSSLWSQGFLTDNASASNGIVLGAACLTGTCGGQPFIIRDLISGVLNSSSINTNGSNQFLVATPGMGVSNNNQAPQGMFHSQFGIGSGILPTITASAAALIGDTVTALGSGTGKAYGVIGLGKTTSDAAGDKVYGGWFKASAGTRQDTEVGLHAESASGVPSIIAEFANAGNIKTQIDANGVLKPFTAGTPILGTTALPIGTIQFGTAATNNFAITPAATGAARTVTLPDPGTTAFIGMNLNATNGLYQSKRGVAGCTTAASIGGTCASDITITWNTAFADANYSVTCTGSTPTAVPAAPFVVSATKLAATVHINYFAITAVAASYATIDCIAVHD